MTCERCSDPLFILSVLYPERGVTDLQNWLEHRLAGFSVPLPADAAFDQRDAFLITRADQFTGPGELPLLTPFETASGTRWLWTTFSVRIWKAQPGWDCRGTPRCGWRHLPITPEPDHAPRRSRNFTDT